MTNDVANLALDVYTKDNEPVAAVFWRHADSQPFLGLKKGYDGCWRKFALLSNDDIPAHDCRVTHMEISATFESNYSLPIKIYKGGNDVLFATIDLKGFEFSESKSRPAMKC